MGVLFSRLAALFGTQEQKIVMVGLDNAGKTTILYALHLGEVVLTRPTIGVNVERVSFRNTNFVVWDLAGQETLRPTWEQYFSAASAIIMVVDSTDVARLGAVRRELFKALEHHDLGHAALLVFANKQDLAGALSAADLAESLGLVQIQQHAWHIQVRSFLRSPPFQCPMCSPPSSSLSPPTPTPALLRSDWSRPLRGP